MSLFLNKPKQLLIHVKKRNKLNVKKLKEMTPSSLVMSYYGELHRGDALRTGRLMGVLALTLKHSIIQ